MLLALDDSENGWTEADDPKETIADTVVNLLIRHAPMLEEYFSMRISPRGELLCLPDLVPGYMPPFMQLPLFLLRLGVECNWSEEQPCLQSVARELAYFYQVQPGMYISCVSSNEDQKQTSTTATESAPSNNKTMDSLTWVTQHVLFPAMRFAPPQRPAHPCSAGGFIPPKQLNDTRAVVQVACLQNLYKIFERC